MTLLAEWDVESIILDLYKELGIQFVFKHVKSHQDDDTPTANLPLKTRLNIETNRLAAEYMIKDETHQPIVTLFPTAKAHLIIQDVTVTRNLPQAI